MNALDIAYEKFIDLNKRSALEYLADKIPFAGLSLKLKRLRGRRENILVGLEKEIENPEKLDMVNRLMIDHNQESIDTSSTYHTIFNVILGVSGLVGAGVLIGYGLFK